MNLKKILLCCVVIFLCGSGEIITAAQPSAKPKKEKKAQENSGANERSAVVLSPVVPSEALLETEGATAVAVSVADPADQGSVKKIPPTSSWEDLQKILEQKPLTIEEKAEAAREAPWQEKMREMVRQWYTTQVADRYVLERFLSTFYLQPPYAIVLAQIQQEKFSEFIEFFNRQTPGAGHRCLDESVNYAVRDDCEPELAEIVEKVPQADLLTYLPLQTREDSSNYFKQNAQKSQKVVQDVVLKELKSIRHRLILARILLPEKHKEPIEYPSDAELEALACATAQNLAQTASRGLLPAIAQDPKDRSLK